MSSWNCSSCQFWGSPNDTDKLQRKCTIRNKMQLADNAGCCDFSKAVRSMTLEEAILSGKIKKPRNVTNKT